MNNQYEEYISKTEKETFIIEEDLPDVVGIYIEKIKIA